MRTAVVGKYGDLNNFLLKFNPSKQSAYCKSIRCYTGMAPTMAEVRIAYGTEAPKLFIVPQLVNFIKFCNYQSQYTKELFEELAETLADTFYFLKATEMMMFFRKAKGGAYGDFYGNPSPARITAAMREFVQERNFIVQKYSASPPPDPSPTAISFEEYKRLRERAEKGDEEAREALKPPKR